MTRNSSTVDADGSDAQPNDGADRPADGADEADARPNDGADPDLPAEGDDARELADAPTPADLETEAATARVLRVLAQSYLEPPTGERLDRLAAWADDWLAAADDQPEEMAEALRTLRDADDADPEHLRQEFTRLFRGISRSESPNPPYESLYRDGQLYSSTTTEVRRGYLAAGLDVADDESNEPPDHLGIELQFLAVLCEYAADPDAGELSRTRARDAQEWFLDEHLLTWIVGLRGQVLQADPPEFYHAVLDLTVETLQAHRRALHRIREDDP